MQVDQNLLVESDRIISSFPIPQLAAFSPHEEVDFHPTVKAVCTSIRGSTASFKTCKCVVVGQVAVGKTSLVNRFCHKTFQRDYKATIGVDFEVEKLAILGVPFRLQIWDTAGQERFRSIGSAYYRGAHAVIAAFDLSEPETLERAVQWTEDACQGAFSASSDGRAQQQPAKFLVGTKRDAVGDTKYRTVAASAAAVAARLGAEFWPTSALTGHAVSELFFRVSALAFQTAVLRDAELPGGDSRSAGPRLAESTAPIKLTGGATASANSTSKAGISGCCS